MSPPPHRTGRAPRIVLGMSLLTSVLLACWPSAAVEAEDDCVATLQAEGAKLNDAILICAAALGVTDVALATYHAVTWIADQIDDAGGVVSEPIARVRKTLLEVGED